MLISDWSSDVCSSDLFYPQAPVVRQRRLGVFAWLALDIALLLSIPIVSVLANVFRPSEGVWGHHVATVLTDYIANTLWQIGSATCRESGGQYVLMSVGDDK